MRLTTKGRYAVTAMLDIALHGRDAPVSVMDIAERQGISNAYLEQLFSRLNRMISFFIQHHDWSEWHQLAPHWLEDYIDAELREGKAPSTINWDLSSFRVFCQFLIIAR